MKQPAPPTLVRALLDEAGIPGEPTVVEVPTPGRVNTTTIVAVGTERYAVRAYGWPFGEPCAFDRRAKEVVVHRRLAEAGVPVAEILSVASVEGLDGALLSYVPGELLGAVAQRAAPAALERAWGEAGAALRTVHDLDGGGPAGFLAEDGVQPFPEGGYGRRLAAGIVPWPDITPPDVALLDRALDALVPVLDARPVRLGHSDANPWNVMVVQHDGLWRLSAWLDWEFAWMADPAFDLMRLAVQRYAPIGPAPDALWQGYGARPDPVAFAAATLHYVLTTRAEHAAGTVTPEIAQAVAHGPDPTTALHDLADLVL